MSGENNSSLLQISGTRRVILTLYLLALFVVCIWVPWDPAPLLGNGVFYLGDRARHAPPHTIPNYGFIWAPPLMELPPAGDGVPVYKQASVDMERVALEILGLSSLCAFCLVLSHGLAGLAEWVRREVKFTL